MSRTAKNKVTEFFRVYDEEELEAFRHKVPNGVTLRIEYDDGFYMAEVKKIDNKPISQKDTVLTQAKTPQELVTNINDLVLTYLDFPEKVKLKMPQLVSPEFINKEVSGQHIKSSKKVVFAK